VPPRNPSQLPAWPPWEGDGIPLDWEVYPCSGTIFFTESGDVHQDSHIFVEGYGTEGEPIYPKKGPTDHFRYKPTETGGEMEFADGELTGCPAEIRWKPSQSAAPENESKTAGSGAGAKGDERIDGGVPTTNSGQRETLKEEQVPSMTIQ
jgi:hypothetical protein